MRLTSTYKSRRDRHEQRDHDVPAGGIEKSARIDLGLMLLRRRAVPGVRYGRMTPVKLNQPKPWTAEKERIRKEQVAIRTTVVSDLPLFAFGSMRARKKRSADYIRERRDSDTGFKMKEILRIRILMALGSGAKSGSTMELIGCSIPDFRKHIESTFKEGMTWENFGAWQVDHRRPCASFDLTKETEQRACFHYTNTQALWRTHNASKGARWNPN